MTPVDVIWLSLHEGIHSRGPWDTGLLEQLFADRIWPTGYEFRHHEVAEIPDGIDKAIVILPARHHVEDVAELNRQLGKLTAVVMMLMGDEEAIFPWKEIVHGNLRFWIQLPHPERHRDLFGSAVFFGDGYKADTDEILATLPADRDLPWSFSGQVTNPRRLQAVDALMLALRKQPSAYMLRTPGFTQGAPRPEYLATLRRSKVAPAPGGPFTADTFRVFEALEAGCIPLADDRSATGTGGYWRMLSLLGGPPPFPIIDDWAGIEGVIELALGQWPQLANRSTAWWSGVKASLVFALQDDLTANGLLPDMPPAVIVTSSPTTHPDPLGMLMTTIGSAPEKWPVLVLFDGVRPEQAHLADAYHRYVRSAMDVLGTMPRVGFAAHDEHRHQAVMTRYAVEAIPNPVILFLEHDAPLVLDEPIDWQGCVDLVAGGHFDVIRFHHEAHVHPHHEHLMYGPATEYAGVPLRRTRQWSQRPHLASTAYYRRILAEHFPGLPRTMIEDKMHSVCQVEPYDRNRLALYHPAGGNIKRSYHLDGRGTEPKFDMEL